MIFKVVTELREENTRLRREVADLKERLGKLEAEMDHAQVVLKAISVCGLISGNKTVKYMARLANNTLRET